MHEHVVDPNVVNVKAIISIQIIFSVFCLWLGDKCTNETQLVASYLSDLFHFNMQCMSHIFCISGAIDTIAKKVNKLFVCQR